MAKTNNPPKNLRGKMMKEVTITAKPIVRQKDTTVVVSSGRWPKISVSKSKIDSVVARSGKTVKDQAKAFYGTAIAKKHLNSTRDTSSVRISNNSGTRNNSTSDTMYGIAKSLNKKPKPTVLVANKRK